MRVNGELHSRCYGVEGRTAGQLLWALRKNCRAVVTRVNEELYSSCYEGEGRTA